MKSFTFQLYSDMHLEFYKKTPKITPLADYLFLAGDISKINHELFEDFFNYCSNNWKQVFYVLGNHEYYHSKKTYKKLNEEYKEFFNKYKNIHLLDNQSIELDDVVIIGSTLWSRPPSFSGFNDFKYILKKNNKDWNVPIDITDFNNLHFECYNFLMEEINKYKGKGKKIIVMTHFPPSQDKTSHPKYDAQPSHLKDYYSTNVVEKLPDDNHGIIAWLYGHTHYSTIINHPKNIQLISNQMGYKDEMINTDFNPEGLYKLILEY